MSAQTGSITSSRRLLELLARFRKPLKVKPSTPVVLQVCETRLASLYFSARSGHPIVSDLEDLISKCGLGSQRLSEVAACLTCEDEQMALTSLLELYESLQDSLERIDFRVEDLSCTPLLVLR